MHQGNSCRIFVVSFLVAPNPSSASNMVNHSRTQATNTSLLCATTSDFPTVSGSAPARMGESNYSDPTMTIPDIDTETRSSCSLPITSHVGGRIPAYLTRNVCRSIHQATGIRALWWDHGRSAKAIDFFIVSRRPMQVNFSLLISRRLATPWGFEPDTYPSVTKLATAVLRSKQRDVSSTYEDSKPPTSAERVRRVVSIPPQFYLSSIAEHRSLTICMKDLGSSFKLTG